MREGNEKKRRAAPTDPALLRERYAQGRASGKSQRQALRDAMQDTPTSTPETLDARACRLEKESKVRARIEELQRRAQEEVQLDRAGIARLLADFAADDSKADSIRLKAADQLARVVGAYEDHSTVSISGAILTGEDKAAALREFLSGLRD